MSRAKLFTPVYMQFPLLVLFAKNCGYFYFFIIHIPHCTAQLMDSERVGVLLAAVLIYLLLMQNTFVWLYSILWHFWFGVFVHQLCSWHTTLFPRLPRNVMLSSLPSFLICVLLQVCITSQAQAHFGQSCNTAIKVFTCLYISIKIGISHLCYYDYACCHYELNCII